jgi:hypothetical protein
MLVENRKVLGMFWNLLDTAAHLEGQNPDGKWAFYVDKHRRNTANLF